MQHKTKQGNSKENREGLVAHHFFLYYYDYCYNCYALAEVLANGHFIVAAAITSLASSRIRCCFFVRIIIAPHLNISNMVYHNMVYSNEQQLKEEEN